MKKKLLLSIFGLILGAVGALYAQVTTYDYTGSPDTYEVPPGVYEISIECYGAAGATGLGAAGGAGGLGGYAYGELSVTPGQILNIYVGGQDGYNGGGDGGLIGAGNGGGASDVRSGGVTLGDRIIIAGGGGGGGSTGCVAAWAGGVGGAGGGGAGAAGADSPNGGGGFGGTSGTGGAEGIGCDYALGTPGLDDGTGGDGQGCCCPTTPGGGGGGGGFVIGGGGGGASAGTTGCSGNDKGGGGGGAGGTSFTGGDLTATVVTDGIRSGDGQIIITELCAALTVSVTETEICLGESFTVDAVGTGSISWDGGVINGEPFTPETAGEFSYTATSDADGDCGYVLDILVNELPEVTLSSDISEICLGEEIVFTAGGADTYEFDPVDIVDGVAYTPMDAGELAYSVVGTEELTGCKNEATVDIIVNALPEIVANASSEDICEGDELILTGSGATDYEWDLGVEDGVAFTPSLGTETYTVTGTDDNGCVNTASVEVTVHEALDITFVTEDEMMGDDGSIDITVTGGTAPYSFDWDNDGAGDFDDSEDLTGVSGGTYTVVVMDENGCEMSIEIGVDSQLNIDELSSLGLNIYPNPTMGEVNVNVEGTFIYTLKSVKGDVLLRDSATNSALLDLESFENGVYFITVEWDNHSETIKIVKQ